MAMNKQVALVFLASEGGVDGAKSIYGDAEPSSLKRLLDKGIGSLIKRTQFAIPPLALMILASIEVPGVEQTICDLRFEEFPFDRKWDLVGISVQTGMVAKAFELADRLRKHGIPVVLGGPHVTMFPDSCRPHADSLVHGEADDLWADVLRDLTAGTLKPEYRADTVPDLSLHRPVSRASLKQSRYFTTNLVQTGRGCPYQCDFCNVHVLNGRVLRQRKIEHIVDEVRRFSRDDKRIFFFVDDSINGDPLFAQELFSKLIPLNISWFGQATTALGQQPELLDTFARSGCRALLVGIESIEPSSRSAHRKTQNRTEELAGNIRAIRQSGICLYGSFIYGLDGDTLATPAAILDFIQETRLDVPGINTLRPIPGTKVFDRLREEGRLLFDADDLTAFRYTFGQEMLYRPKNIPLPEFIESYSELTRKVFNIGNAIRRGIDAPGINAAVLFFNLFYTHLYRLSRNDLRKQLEILRSA
ncbi:Radical SAM domain protein [Chlorobaculum parvum NCIB 8327]|uniref:Radical SAM domain protein n=1 Tax=Chlorobaculum parvum (strain DSM 263 / NCIMB 8327) TaxID=517417 RepID=B3QLD2_CHLP8|nr:radical SAM protein [Chlorobaculum parvum]ACF12370.1 Radical SAM domain protein [Chlorobaculum parvum NCIB 8327]